MGTGRRASLDSPDQPPRKALRDGFLRKALQQLQRLPSGQLEDRLIVPHSGLVQLEASQLTFNDKRAKQFFPR